MDVAPVTKKIIAFGSKQVFLPKFTIALVRTPLLSPYHARFLVPLNFSKYDLRDYLYHAYDIKTFNVRSFVKMMPVRDTRDQPRHWFREQSKKYMTVEMEKPFVWPEEPADWEPWGKEEGEEMIKEAMRQYGTVSTEERRAEARSVREQARALLRGKRWDGEVDGKGEDKEVVAEVAEEEGKKSLLELWEEQRTPQMLGRREERV